jgi:hypothetical protein
MGQALDIVNKYLLEQDVSVVADDFRFVGPVDQRTGKDAFLQLSADFAPLVAGMRMLKQFENGNDVCSIYEMDLNLPNGTSTTLKIADWVVVKDGKMVEEQIVYDAREYAAAMAQ